MPHSPLTLRAAAVVQAVESVVVLAATVLAGVDAATGQSYHVSSGIALTVIGAAAAAALAWVALGVARARRWSRTPAVLTQLFVGIVGIYLLQGHRLDWGVPSVVLAAAGFATLFVPPTMRALTRSEPETDAQAPAGDRRAGGGRKPAAASPATQTAPSGRKPAAASSGTKTAAAPSGRKPAPASSGTKTAPSGRKPAAALSGTESASSGRKPAAASSGTKSSAVPSARNPAAAPAGRKPPASTPGRKRPAR